MIVFLIAFFAPSRFRTRETWLMLLVLMLGYYSPFWIGEPFLPALSAPNQIASFVHVGMGALTLLSLFVGRPAFTREMNAG